MCEENMNITADPIRIKRYFVNANKSIYVSAEFDTPEEAIQEAARLVNEGYDIVSVRDNTSNADVW